MKISIITPCYNHGQYLDELLESLQQTILRTSFELIIVNDGSTDSFTIEKLGEIEKGCLYNYSPAKPRSCYCSKQWNRKSEWEIYTAT
ncbi:MAG: glycosyltransferase [Chitinophagaceae bacterium]|nr:glycosyltransferase [Chitinophagaceae bacterium]